MTSVAERINKASLTPVTGVSVMLTGDHKLPLKVKADYRYPTNYQMTVNAEGVPVLVFEANRKMLEDGYQINIEKKIMNPDLYYPYRFPGDFVTVINYWATLSKDELIRGGQLFKGIDPILNEKVSKFIKENYEPLDLKNDISTALVSLEFEAE